MKKYLFILLLSILFAGCSSTGVIQIAPDTYMVSKIGAGIFTTTASLKASTLREANKFAESKGKIMIALEVNETPFVSGGANPSVELQFRVVDKDDEEARRTHLAKSPDLVIKRDDSLNANINVNNAGNNNSTDDMYAELIKLNDLKEKGILSDKEFKKQKQKILKKY